MSQSATFYPVNSTDFAAIRRNPNDLNLLSERNDYVCFQGTHEGLRFLLSKGLSEQENNLVNEIFYPTAYIGEAAQTVLPDAAELQDFADISDDEENDDFGREPIPFHDPGKVRRIASYLNATSGEELLAEFDPLELNQEKVYPWCWNNNLEANQGYNERHLLEDYQRLKDLFDSATMANSYLLCFVG